MKLKSKKLADVTLVPILTRSQTRMLRVDIGRCQMGFVEKMPQDRHTITPWKAFRGLGISVNYVGAFYQEQGGVEAAVAAVLEMV